MVNCRLLAVCTRTHQSADLYIVMVTSEKKRPIDFKIYRFSGLLDLLVNAASPGQIYKYYLPPSAAALPS
jgi:hypothetical protein